MASIKVRDHLGKPTDIGYVNADDRLLPLTVLVVSCPYETIGNMNCAYRPPLTAVRLLLSAADLKGWQRDSDRVTFLAWVESPEDNPALDQAAAEAFLERFHTPSQLGNQRIGLGRYGQGTVRQSALRIDDHRPERVTPP